MRGGRAERALRQVAHVLTLVDIHLPSCDRIRRGGRALNPRLSEGEITRLLTSAVSHPTDTHTLWCVCIIWSVRSAPSSLSFPPAALRSAACSLTGNLAFAFYVTRIDSIIQDVTSCCWANNSGAVRPGAVRPRAFLAAGTLPALKAALALSSLLVGRLHRCSALVRRRAEPCHQLAAPVCCVTFLLPPRHPCCCYYYLLLLLIMLPSLCPALFCFAHSFQAFTNGSSGCFRLQLFSKARRNSYLMQKPSRKGPASIAFAAAVLRGRPGRAESQLCVHIFSSCCDFPSAFAPFTGRPVEEQGKVCPQSSALKA